MSNCCCQIIGPSTEPRPYVTCFSLFHEKTQESTSTGLFQAVRVAHPPTHSGLSYSNSSWSLSCCVFVVFVAVRTMTRVRAHGGTGLGRRRPTSYARFRIRERNRIGLHCTGNEVLYDVGASAK